MATESPTPKKIRSQPADIIVAVGSGDAMREFECYKVVLSFASPYFDNMLSASMSESNNNRIEFPDKDPKAWEEFYKVIDPTQIGMANHDVIDEANAMVLTPLFHEFQMDSCIEQCDLVLAQQVKCLAMNITVGVGSLGSQLGWGEISIRLPQTSKSIIELLECACLYDLKKTQANAEHVIQHLLSRPAETIKLFNSTSINVLVKLFLPLEMEIKDDVEDGCAAVVSRGKSQVLWDFLQSWEFGDICLEGQSMDTINNGLLPVLVEAKMHHYAGIVKQEESDGRDRAAQTIIRSMLNDMPNDIFDRMMRERVAARKSAIECTKNALRDQFKKNKSSFIRLGIQLPQSLS